MAANKPVFPASNKPPHSQEGRLQASQERELGRVLTDVRKIKDGRIAGAFALPSVPTGGTFAQGDVVRNSNPSLTLSGTDQYFIHGWEYVSEGSGTLTWVPIKIWSAEIDTVGASAIGNSITATLYSAKPSGTVDGTLYMPKTTGFAIERATGTGWEPWGPIYPLSPVPATSWSWNPSNTSVTVTHQFGGLYFQGIGGQTLSRYYLRARPDSSPKVTVLIQANILAHQFQAVGLCFWNDAAQRAISYEIIGDQTTNTGYVLQSDKRNSTSYNSTYFQFPIGFGGQIWLQMEESGTRRHYRYSNNGVQFQDIFSVTNSDFLGSVDQVGVYLQPYNSITAVPMSAAIISWKEE